MRWIVERPRGKTNDDVGADHFRIIDGALVFYDAEGLVEIAYADGQWETVVPDPEE